MKDIPTPRTDAAEAEYRDPTALHGMDMKTVFGRMRELERELVKKNKLLALAAAELPRVSGPVHERIKVYFREYSERIQELEERELRRGEEQEG